MTTSWQEEAACSADKQDPDLWFSDSVEERRIALDICSGCPVLSACAEWAITEWPDTPDEWIVGGMTKNKLARVRKERGVAKPPRLGVPRPLPKPKPVKEAPAPCQAGHCMRRVFRNLYCRKHYEMGYGRKNSGSGKKTYSKDGTGSLKFKSA